MHVTSLYTNPIVYLWPIIMSEKLALPCSKKAHEINALKVYSYFPLPLGRVPHWTSITLPSNWVEYPPGPQDEQTSAP